MTHRLNAPWAGLSAVFSGVESLRDLGCVRSQTKSNMWLATRTRPDISATLGILASQMVIRPRYVHGCLKQLWRHIVGTGDLDMTSFESNDVAFGELLLTLYVDESFSTGGGRSRTGMAMQLVNPSDGSESLVQWASRRQTSMATSAPEAEVSAMAGFLDTTWLALQGEKHCAGEFPYVKPTSEEIVRYYMKNRTLILHEQIVGGEGADEELPVIPIQGEQPPKTSSKKDKCRSSRKRTERSGDHGDSDDPSANPPSKGDEAQDKDKKQDDKEATINDGEEEQPPETEEQRAAREAQEKIKRLEQQLKEARDAAAKASEDKAKKAGEDLIKELDDEKAKKEHKKEKKKEKKQRKKQSKEGDIPPSGEDEDSDEEEGEKKEKPEGESKEKPEGESKEEGDKPTTEEKKPEDKEKSEENPSQKARKQLRNQKKVLQRIRNRRIHGQKYLERHVSLDKISLRLQKRQGLELIQDQCVS